MKPSFRSAALLISLTAPVHILAQNYRHGERHPVVVDGGVVVVTETAYTTITGSPDATGAPKEDVLVLPTPIETESPIETSAPSTTPSSSETPTLSEIPTSSPTISESPSLTEGPSPTSISSDGSDSGDSGGSGGGFTIAITNLYGSPLSIAIGSNSGGPSPDGDPQPTTVASQTSYTFPSGWAGRIAVGKSLSGANSLIEASYGLGNTAVDVSYVDAYSVPITCSVDGEAVTGCNLELWNQGIDCDTPSDNHDACINSSAHMDNGPPPAFFAACAGAAYTFPNDNTATDGYIAGNEVSCCIGTSCPSPPTQKSSKRSLPRRDPAVSKHLHSHQHRHNERRSSRSHVHHFVREAKLRN